MVFINGKFLLSELGIGCWNIQGIWKRINSFRYNKLNDPYILKSLVSQKIFGLIETHHKSNEEASLHIDGYKCFSTCRPKRKNVKHHKPSGGLAVYVHNSIRPGVTRHSLSGTESIFIKLKKEFFGLEKDIFVCFAYCVPYSSKVFSEAFMPDDIFEDLESKLSQLVGLGSIVLLGDMNSRTLCLPDHLSDDGDHHVPLPPTDLYNTDQTGSGPRVNMDTGYNNYGPKFLELCKRVSLRILNGRCFGDLFGNLTCFTPRGHSTVDYGAVSPDLIAKIRFFKVNPIMEVFSDHCSINLQLKVHVTNSVHRSVYNYVPKPEKIIWDKNKKSKFCEMLSSYETQSKIETFFNQDTSVTQNSVDNAVEFLTNILKETSTFAGMLLKRGICPKKPPRNVRFVKVKPPKWHDKSCHDLFKSLKQTSDLLSKDPKNSWLRGRLATESKQYHKLLRVKQKEFIDNTFNDLDKMHDKDPKAYMELVKALRDGSHDKPKVSDTDSVEPEEWLEHFKNLLGKTKEASVDDVDHEKFVKENIDKFTSELDEPFSKEELKKVVTKLKNNKSASFDLINNEMIKASFPALSGIYLQIFNNILEKSFYPKIWKNDILSPLHKSGGKDDPGNFRGISLSSCLGKVFCSLLRNRLETKCSPKINKFQISGKKGVRTCDHLLVFKHLIDKYVKKGKSKLFVAFFDLKKAFDMVNRSLLFFKLLTEYGVGGKFLKIFQAIYRENQIFVKLSNGLTQPFISTAGVKQGCVLSPLCFNLFINNLHCVYDNNKNNNTFCDPVSINNNPINCLMWADDCAIFSLSEFGLQNSIQLTANFFESLGLPVNTKKTKVMVFNVGGLGPKNFKNLRFFINGCALEI